MGGELLLQQRPGRSKTPWGWAGCSTSGPQCYSTWSMQLPPGAKFLDPWGDLGPACWIRSPNPVYRDSADPQGSIPVDRASAGPNPGIWGPAKPMWCYIWAHRAGQKQRGAWFWYIGIYLAHGPALHHLLGPWGQKAQVPPWVYAKLFSPTLSTSPRQILLPQTWASTLKRQHLPLHGMRWLLCHNYLATNGHHRESLLKSLQQSRVCDNKMTSWKRGLNKEFWDAEKLGQSNI